jgi:hypothetical protein
MTVAKAGPRLTETPGVALVLGTGNTSELPRRPRRNLGFRQKAGGFWIWTIPDRAERCLHGERGIGTINPFVLFVVKEPA